MKHLIAFMIIALSLSGCGKQIPEPPEHDRCTYSIRFQKFRCKNSKTGLAENRRLDDPRMENAEAVPREDYLELEDWTDDLIELAKQRCR